MSVVTALIPPLVILGFLLALVITAARATDWADTSPPDDRAGARGGNTPGRRGSPEATPTAEGTAAAAHDEGTPPRAQ